MITLTTWYELFKWFLCHSFKTTDLANCLWVCVKLNLWINFSKKLSTHHYPVLTSRLESWRGPNDRVRIAVYRIQNEKQKPNGKRPLRSLRKPLSTVFTRPIFDIGGSRSASGTTAVSPSSDSTPSSAVASSASTLSRPPSTTARPRRVKGRPWPIGTFSRTRAKTPKQDW